MDAYFHRECVSLFLVTHWSYHTTADVNLRETPNDLDPPGIYDRVYQETAPMLGQRLCMFLRVCSSAHVPILEKFRSLISLKTNPKVQSSCLNWKHRFQYDEYVPLTMDSLVSYFNY